MQCFSTTLSVSIVWIVACFSLAIGDSGAANALVGIKKFLMSQVLKNSKASDTPESVFAMFQLTFAIFTSAVIVGKFAKRMRCNCVLLFRGLWVVFAYVPITHWVLARV